MRGRNSRCHNVYAIGAQHSSSHKIRTVYPAIWIESLNGYVSAKTNKIECKTSRKKIKKMKIKIANLYINWFIDYIPHSLEIIYNRFICAWYTYFRKKLEIYVLYMFKWFYEKKIIREFRRNQNYVHWMYHLIFRNIHNRIFI